MLENSVPTYSSLTGMFFFKEIHYDPDSNLLAFPSSKEVWRF